MADGTITVRGLQGAAAIVTARMLNIDLTQDQLLGDTPPAEALAALVDLVVHVLSTTSPAGLTTAVQTAGRIASQLEADSAQS